MIRDLLEHAKRPGVISMAGGIRDPDLFPVDEIADATTRVLRQSRGVLQYGLTSGEHLRVWRLPRSSATIPTLTV